MNSVGVWCGNYGEYLIPECFADVVITKKGWPDMRYRFGYAAFMKWVAEQEKAAKSDIVLRVCT